MARVGHHSGNAVVNAHYSHVPRAGADIIGSTTNAAAALDSDSFDLVVVDEATQASQPATLVPWLKGTPLVLAGDHRQLPPYCSNETAKDEELHISLFEHLFNLYGSDVSERLDIQYRMNREIANFASEAFYDRPLQHGPENAAWTIGDLESIIGLNVVGDEETTDQTSSKFNSAEADVVARSVKHLLNSDVDTADIGIITPYTAQIRAIREALDDKEIHGRSNIKIDTIDSFQGSEREAIIVSFVRSNPYNSSGFLTFPDEGKLRLNVALTRARRRLVLVGNWETLSTVADHKSPDESSADVYAQLHEYLNEMGRLRDISL
jgi:superfamily I DNA and/or RNA helicase